MTSVHLFAECLSEGQVNVSCLSEGGSNPQYSFTLNGNKPSGHELLSENIKSNTIVLRPNVAGRLVCSVRTNVSFLLKEKITSTCGEWEFMVKNRLFETNNSDHHVNNNFCLLFLNTDFVNCTSNGIHISKWVFKENNTLCVEPLPERHNIMGKTTDLETQL